ncbi:Cyclic nucleotide-binding domain-containing protein [Pricia antarctica]|uniref:Cyclic nucleotide-binding domain-containing protein n=1 Tax=Pricia antarctica TaxID=641691 RepID=A0A1G7DBP5_9FLAO|nr:Crp/Fnr family transcriptional regulator [Pricia antarctica]SDE48923.1 Cyclic nucleotide-binding domain-containing protein [Pricia antarctica]
MQTAFHGIMGAGDYLTKPFEESELNGAIESRLAKMAILNDNPNKNLPTAISKKTIHDLTNCIDDNGQREEFKSGKTVYREGTYSNTYLVTHGIVKRHELDRNGKELITGIFSADDFFGFGSFVPNSSHSDYATAMVVTVVVGIPAQTLKSLLEQNPDLILKLIQFLSENLTNAKTQLLKMA